MQASEELMFAPLNSLPEKAPMNKSHLFLLIAILFAAAGPAFAQTPDYARAERLLSWHAEPLVKGAAGSPNWIDGSDRFWYRVTRGGAGADFVLVDPDRNTRRLAFENARLAAAMSLAADTTYDPTKLPFRTFDFVDEERAIQFDVRRQRFICDVVDYRCTIDEVPPTNRGFVASPDSVWEAFVQEHDLYIRPLDGGDTIRLTTDGEPLWGYGLRAPNPSAQRSDTPRRPTLQWSPDSRVIAVQRTDEREVGLMSMFSSIDQRPEFWTYPYALPGDSIIPRPAIHLIDIDAHSNILVPLDEEMVFISFAGAMDSTWTQDAQRLRLHTSTRGQHKAQLVEVDVATGAPRVLASETSKTWIDLNHRGPSNWSIANDGADVIWFSQRDGFGHLYRYDGNGELKNQITSGPWVVGQIHHVDEGRQRVYFTAWGREEGRNPYYTHLYRVNFDGSDLRLLTPEEGNHEVHFSPSGRFFVNTHSEVDRPPVTVVRRADDGRIVRELEEADITELLSVGWRPPEPFRVKARDGITDIYGLMYKPSHFDPDKSYPIINFIYPGPQTGSIRSWSFTLEYWAARLQAEAELGFIVLTIDHMGTPQRSKAFHDNYYGNLGENGIPDHIAAIRQLAARHSFLDLNRIGVYGNSGGGFASTRAILEFPDFFHVAVSGSGNHDNRTYHYTWGEKYHGLMTRDTVQGTDSYLIQSNAELAGNLKGKLLLIHGELDDNVHPAMTLQVVHALIEANKEFDMLYMPGREHSMREPYIIRRTWDYFLRHLLGVEPPLNYEIREGG